MSSLGFGEKTTEPPLVSAALSISEQEDGTAPQPRISYEYSISFVDEGNPQSSQQSQELHGALTQSSQEQLAVRQKPQQFSHQETQRRETFLHAMKEASLLEKLRSSPPDHVRGIQFRLDKDLAEARRLMQALGYYGAKVQGAVLSEDKVKVVLQVEPGPVYTLGQSAIYYQEQEGNTLLGPAAPAEATPIASNGQGQFSLPESLSAAGLRQGNSAEAKAILEAVESLPAMLGRRGYPLAKVVATRYIVDHESRELCASIQVVSGPRVRMGKVRVRGESAVDTKYLESLKAWQEGQWWNQSEVDKYEDTLTRLGLFRSLYTKAVPAEIRDLPSLPLEQIVAMHGADGRAGGVTVDATVPAYGSPQASPSQLSSPVAPTVKVTPMTATLPADNTVGVAALFESSPPGVPFASASDRMLRSPTPVYDLLLAVADAPQRTLGGGLNYESDRGVGIQAYWEHRNLLGAGEHFRAEGNVWQDTQYARALFRKPAFMHPQQQLTAEAWLRNEKTIAYTQQAGSVSTGMERRLWSSFTGSFGLTLEGGSLRDNIHSRRDYSMFSIPLSLRYEGAGSVLDSVKGVRAGLSVRPTWGWYGHSFSVMPSRFDVAGFYPLGSVGEGEKAHERAVLAARVAMGTLWRDDAQKVPASIRYYGGGGGSVRGYAYQSLGPRDRNQDPLGGASFAELGLEVRVRVTDTISVVPFLDGGNIYPGSFPEVLKDGVQWGAGMGLRYHTPVGPLRLDIATPLNPRANDAPLFLYLSIGQSF